MFEMLLLVILAGPAPTFVHDVPTAEVFDEIATPSSTRPDITAATKFLAPATSDDELVATVYQNVNVYEFHLDFMATEFPEQFPGLAPEEYRRIVEQRETRQYFAGPLFRIEPAPGEVIY